MAMCGVMFRNTYSTNMCHCEHRSRCCCRAAAAWGWLNMSDCGRAPGARLLVLVWARVRCECRRRHQAEPGNGTLAGEKGGDATEAVAVVPTLLWNKKGLGRAPPPTGISSAAQHARAFRVLCTCCHGHRARVRMWKCTSAVERVRVEIWVSKRGGWHGGME